MRERLLASVLMMILLGCNGSDPLPPTSGVRVESPVEAPSSASWDGQLAEVRAGRSDEIRLTHEVLTADRLHALSTGCEELASLVVDRADITGADLRILRSLPRLRWLKLPAPIDDDGAGVIAGCVGLEILNLPDAIVTDDGLARLTDLERLELLRLGSPHITDAGLAALNRLSRLRYLHLVDVPLSDAGLRHVASIGTLESFYLDGGSATDEGLRRLLADRSDLHFHKDQRHLPGDPNTHPHN